MRRGVGILVILGVLLVSAAPAQAHWQQQTTTETFLSTTFTSATGCDAIVTTVRGFSTITTVGKGHQETLARSGASVDILIDWDDTCTQQKVVNTSAHVEFPDTTAVLVTPNLKRLRLQADLRVFRAGISPSDPGSWHDVRIEVTVQTSDKVRTRNEHHTDPATKTRTRLTGDDATGTASGSVRLDGAGVWFSGWRELAVSHAAAAVSQLSLMTFTKE